MPSSMSAMGIFTGGLIIIFAGITSGMGLYFLSRCALRIERGHSSFFAVAKRTYPGAAVVFDTAIAIKCFGNFVLMLNLISRCCRVISYYHRRSNASSRCEYISGIKVITFSLRSTILDYCFHVQLL